MDLIVRPPRRYHVSQDTVEELEAAILADPRINRAETNALAAGVLTTSARALAKAGINAGRALGASRTKHLDSPPRDYFAVMMDLDASRIAPWFVRNARKSIYLFDAWPAKHDAITELVESWGIQFAFVSSSQAATRLSAMSARCAFIWIAEGIDPARYRQRPRNERDIDVLQLGRRHDAHHSLIAPALEEAGRSYVFEKEKGRIIFPSRESFVDGLSRSRISICVPSNITHPERAGDIQTMTVRYLQSMASKCLVLGHAPDEMIELFGYNPVVEIEMDRARDQIIQILANYESYTALIEKNFSVVNSGHTWAHRWERIASMLLPMPSSVG